MDVTLAAAAIDIAIGLGVGFLVGLTGIGGGVLTVPALTLLAGMPTAVAVGTASIYLLVTQAIAVGAHHQQGTLRPRTAAIALSGAIPGAVVGSLLVAQVLRHHEHLLRGMVAAATVLAIFLLATMKKPAADAEPAPLCGADRPICPKLVIGIALSVGIGLLLGATAVGGGVLLVPLFLRYFGLATRPATGTASLVAGVLFMITSGVLATGGTVDWIAGGILTLGSLVGVFCGTSLAGRLPDALLRRMVLGAACLAAVLLMIPRSG